MIPPGERWQCYAWGKSHVDVFKIDSPNKAIVCSVRGTLNERFERGRLLAMAPELVDMLEEIVEAWPGKLDRDKAQRAAALVVRARKIGL